MKAFKKAFIALISLLGLSLTACTTYGTYADASKYLVGDQTYTGELKELDIDWVSGQVTLIEDTTSTEIKIVEESDVELIESEKVHSYFNEGTLKIKYWESGHVSHSFISRNKHIYITYPSLEKLTVDLTSGKFDSKKVSASEIKVNLTSGNVDLDEVVCETMATNVTSGIVNIDKITCNTYEANLTSGSVTIGASTANEMKFSVTSGKVDLTIPESGATVSFTKTSGSLHLDRQDYTKNADGQYVYGDGACKVRIKVTSGKATIR